MVQATGAVRVAHGYQAVLADVASVIGVLVDFLELPRGNTQAAVRQIVRHFIERIICRYQFLRLLDGLGVGVLGAARLGAKRRREGYD